LCLTESIELVLLQYFVKLLIEGIAWTLLNLIRGNPKRSILFVIVLANSHRRVSSRRSVRYLMAIDHTASSVVIEVYSVVESFTFETDC